MKKILISILGLFRRFKLWRLRMQGKTMDNIYEQEIVSGKAWEDFCDTLKASGAALLYGNSPKDPFNQAEGYRYLTRLVRSGLEAFIEFADPEFPVLKRMVHETVKLGADNPDNHYQNAQISGDYEYRIIGHRGSVFYLGFFTQNGSYGSTGGLAPCGALEAKDMTINPDGTFEILLSKSPKGQNWLKIEAETTLLMVRQTFMDKANEQLAQLRIECIGGPKVPRPITPELIHQGLNTASTFVAGASMLFARWANGYQKHANQLPQFDPKVSTAAGGDPNIAYYHSYWKLEKDEALIIEATPPKCRYWNFQLNNYWMESLDYRYLNIHINQHTAVYEPDGSVKVIIAHEDPGHPNWLTTAGHTEGTMLWRWVHAAEHPQPKCRIQRIDNEE